MGTQYTSQTITGYNATPPADDGTETEANKGYWATVKTKLGDPVKTYADDINTAMTTFADFGGVAKSATYTTTTAEHMKTVECTSTFTLTLGAVATMGAGYIVRVKNAGTGLITVDGSGAETIDGDASLTLDPDQWVVVQVNSTTAEYQIIGRSETVTHIPATTGGAANAYTATIGIAAYSTDAVYEVQIHATNTGASTIDFDSLGVKNIKMVDGTDPYADALYAGQVARFVYDGTNMVITSFTPLITYNAINNFDPSGMLSTQYRDYYTALSYTGIGAYSTQDTLQIYIPPDTTTLHYKIKCSTNTASYGSGGRIISPTAGGGTFQTNSTSEAWSGALTLDVSADSGWTTISIQVYVGGGVTHDGFVHAWSWYIE